MVTSKGSCLFGADADYEAEDHIYVQGDDSACRRTAVAWGRASALLGRPALPLGVVTSSAAFRAIPSRAYASRGERYEDRVHTLQGARGQRQRVTAVCRSSPEQFDDLYHALPDADSKLLVETAIETGLRWGELTELRGRDLKARSRLLTVSRVVVELNPKFHPEGKRFLVKDYPKDKEWRRFKLSDQIVAILEDHIIEEKLGTDGLLFIYQPEAANEEPFAPLDPETLGWSEENTKGRRYRHAR